MQAILCSAPRSLERIERPLPVRGKNEVLVRIRRVGVCGTDMHIFQGNQPYFEYPRIMGHEVSGEVVEAPGDSGLIVGEKVCLIPYLHCGICGACQAGKTNCCTKLQVLGVHRDGGMCEFLALPAQNVIAVPDLTLDEAAMVEFLAIGAHGVARAAIGPNDRVLVVGAGPIGVSAIIFAAMRCASVTVLEGRKDRIVLARILGANAIAVGDGDLEGLREATNGQFFDVVFDATGSPKAMERSFDFVAHGGRMVLLSLVKGQIAFSDPEFHKRETTLLASRNATCNDFTTVIDAFRRKDITSARIITHRAELSELPTQLPFWIKPETLVMKAILHVS